MIDPDYEIPLLNRLGAVSFHRVFTGGFTRLAAKQYMRVNEMHFADMSSLLYHQERIELPVRGIYGVLTVRRDIVIDSRTQRKTRKAKSGFSPLFSPENRQHLVGC